jgi:hypothetical protein
MAVNSLAAEASGLFYVLLYLKTVVSLPPSTLPGGTGDLVDVGRVRSCRIR